ncbi:hypothetical protein BX070DRAFT_13985 [Coemansia spiralis]|nr:hypothetical protein BX070DRAFT_13985 [Coemansia spiralis]
MLKSRRRLYRAEKEKRRMGGILDGCYLRRGHMQIESHAEYVLASLPLLIGEVQRNRALLPYQPSAPLLLLPNTLLLKGKQRNQKKGICRKSNMRVGKTHLPIQRASSFCLRFLQCSLPSPPVFRICKPCAYAVYQPPPSSIVLFYLVPLSSFGQKRPPLPTCFLLFAFCFLLGSALTLPPSYKANQQCILLLGTTPPQKKEAFRQRGIMKFNVIFLQ